MNKKLLIIFSLFFCLLIFADDKEKRKTMTLKSKYGYSIVYEGGSCEGCGCTRDLVSVFMCEKLVLQIKSNAGFFEGQDTYFFKDGAIIIGSDEDMLNGYAYINLKRTNYGYVELDGKQYWGSKQDIKNNQVIAKSKSDEELCTYYIPIGKKYKKQCK